MNKHVENDNVILALLEMHAGLQATASRRHGILAWLPLRDNWRLLMRHVLHHSSKHSMYTCKDRQPGNGCLQAWLPLHDVASLAVATALR
jgi:hypothetical protein